MELYDKIGTNYNSTRCADPYLTDRIYELLTPINGGVYLDVGCGTGNYLTALTKKGLYFYGLDPSETMLEKAMEANPKSTFIEGNAENIPLRNSCFDGAITILSLHHWQDIKLGLKEICRVLKPGARLVVFSFTSCQMRGYWLHHYFPKMIEKCMELIPGAQKMTQLFSEAGLQLLFTENYFVKPDLQDHFLYSFKFDPAKYLIPEVRNNTSGFSLHAGKEELENGLAALEADIKSGEINHVTKTYENDLGDYLFYFVTKP